MANETTVIMKIKEDELIKLLYFTKSKQKSKMIYEALIQYILNSDEVEKFANPIFETEFKKALKKTREKYGDKRKTNKSIEKQKEVEPQVVVEEQKEEIKEIKTIQKDTTNDGDKDYF
jgi:hypothetical protein